MTSRSNHALMKFIINYFAELVAEKSQADTPFLTWKKSFLLLSHSFCSFFRSVQLVDNVRPWKKKTFGLAKVQEAHTSVRKWLVKEQW